MISIRSGKCKLCGKPNRGCKCNIGQLCEYPVSHLLEAALIKIHLEWDRVIRNIVFQQKIGSPFENSGQKWKCKEFEVNAYDWNENNEQKYNFKWKDVEVSWYKHLGRGMSCNREIKSEEISKMLDACLKAIIKYEK